MSTNNFIDTASRASSIRSRKKLIPSTQTGTYHLGVPTNESKKTHSTLASISMGAMAKHYHERHRLRSDSQK